jgi:hypothetical protein
MWLAGAAGIAHLVLAALGAVLGFPSADRPRHCGRRLAGAKQSTREQCRSVDCFAFGSQ